MPSASPIRPLARRDPTVRTVARAWRDLTGGFERGRDAQRRTLVACSGGADSSGLLFALAAATSRPGELFVVAHVVHDLRAESEALGDRDAVRGLAERLGVRFAEARVQVRAAGGNMEGAARKLRYGALKKIAAEYGCGFIATAHQADDQLETILMKLIRGSGPRGMAGVAPRRRLGVGGPVVIRPTLSVTRDELERICRDSGWAWRVDRTNADTTRLRAAIRAHVLPPLKAIRPHAPQRAVRAASFLGDAAVLVDRIVGQLLESGTDASGTSPGYRWPRCNLAVEPGLVIGTLVRSAVVRLVEGRSSDTLGSRVVDPIVRAIQSDSREPRMFSCGGAIVRVTGLEVTMQKERE